MGFNSYGFLLFFPAVILIFFLLPQKARHYFLLAASYYFYCCWSPKYALLLAASTLVTFFSGILIAREDNRTPPPRINRKKLWLTLSFIFNLGILFFFKYFDFFIRNANALLSYANLTLDPPFAEVLLPVGISFYTFQALSYTTDVYRKKTPVERNIFKYALFVSFFPQLVAGPIERSSDLLPQMDKPHRFDYAHFKEGLLLMLFGYILKLVIADRAGILVDQIYNNYTSYPGWPLALATILFAIQIYCDFNGYTCIALGAAEVLGFTLTQNFIRPYFSKSIAEFWRRWNITLGRWFKDNLYVPLGGNRHGRFKKWRNTMIVFVASGLWHGASWSFVVWGALHGFYIIAGEALYPLRARISHKLGIADGDFFHKLWCVTCTFILVCAAWVFFRAQSLSQALDIFKLMANPHISTLTKQGLFSLGLGKVDIAILACGIAFLVISSLLCRGGSFRKKLVRAPIFIQWPLYLTGIFTVIIFGVYGAAYNPSAFIYFQF